MKAIKYIALAFAGMLVLSSCESNLDLEQKGVVNTNDYYKTDEEAEAGITNVYSKVQAMLADYIMTKNCLSDDVYAGGRGMAQDELNEFVYTPDNSYIAALFTDYYNVIYAANLIINKVNPDTPAKQRNVAEAKYFRGWAYMELATLYGPAPLVLEAERDNYQSSNTPVEEIWAQVNTDLKEAVDAHALPSKSNVDDKDTPVRITQEAAEAMLGKALVFQGKYQEANQYLDAVINSGLYAMMPLGQRGYLDYSSYLNDNNSEVLFQVNRLNDPVNYGMEIACMWFSLPAGGFANNTNPKNPFYTESWGFCSAAKEHLVEAFQANAKKNGVDDIRYKSTIYSLDDLKELFDLGVQPGRNWEGCCGYFVSKLAALTENHIPMTWAGWQQNSVIMRYAEVLLLAAESHLQSGDQAGALKAINIVRQHAGEPQLSVLTMDDVKLEKQLELCVEGVRYQDLLRWGDAYEQLKDQGKEIAYYGHISGDAIELAYLVKQPDAGFKQGRNELLPFPQKELNVNPNIKQNPGY